MAGWRFFPRPSLGAPDLQSVSGTGQALGPSHFQDPSRLRGFTGILSTRGSSQTPPNPGVLRGHPGLFRWARKPPKAVRGLSDFRSEGRSHVVVKILDPNRNTFGWFGRLGRCGVDECVTWPAAVKPQQHVAQHDALEPTLSPDYLCSSTIPQQTLNLKSSI